MRPAPLALALALLATVAPAAARADTRAADDALLHGRYAEALRAYAAAAKAGDRGALLGLGRTQLRVGDHAAAAATARAAARLPGAPGDAGAALLGEVLRAGGRLADARRELEPVVKRRPRALRARLALARVLHDLGAGPAAQQACESFIDDYNGGTIDKNSAADLEVVAAASHLCENFADAKDTYLQALALDPRRLDANVELGLLFLEKYNTADAARSFGEVLAIDPHHPDAHVGMARVALVESFDAAAAETQVAAVLAVDPRHAGALAVRGEIQVTEEDFAGAAATARQALARNPAATGALVVLGAAAFLTGDRPAYDAARAQALARGPRAAAFFHGVAELAGRHHRYAEAIALDEEALRADPGDAAALAELGQNYLREGDDARGLAALQRAWKRDPYNARTYNILNLFEDVIPKEYRFIERGRLRLRVPAQDRALLERYALPLLERAYADFERRYGALPFPKVQVELFADHQHYAVRTVGLPGLGALGVCFGRVVTALGPRAGQFNWAMVLWHELAHVFAIQLSQSRVPRWFTEGLSEWESQRARPEWRRKSTSEIVAALEAGTLPRLAHLNAAFTRARSLDHMVLAYQQSALVVDFLVRRFGFPKIVEMLRLFGQGLPTDAVLRRATGHGPDALDAEFRADLRARLPRYFGAFAPRYERFRDLGPWEQAARARPADAAAQARLGFAYFARRDLARASAQANRALALKPDLGEAHFLRGELGMAAMNAAAARAGYRAALAAGLDGYELRARLGIVALKAGDLADGERQLRAAAAFDPEQDEPFAQLAQALDRAGRPAEALALFEEVARRNPQAGPALTRLVTAHAAARRWDKVRELAPMALNVNPLEAAVHVAYGRALAARGERRAAAFELESALLCDPPDRAAIQQELDRLRR
ncbi:MAG TPA: tetratricopeptide repeat protein [Polyangia bacterium]|jgi:tetratricopeptide (TPR) repeat protein